MSDDEDDEDDEYDSRIFTDRNAQNLRRIKQRKGLCFVQTSNDDRDDKDDDLIAPIAFDIAVPKCNQQKQVHLLKPVCRFVSLFQRNRKVSASVH